jgi:ribosomal protein S27AE
MHNKRTRHSVSVIMCGCIAQQVKRFPSGKCHSTSWVRKKKKAGCPLRSHRGAQCTGQKSENTPSHTSARDTLVCHRLSLGNPLCLPQHHAYGKNNKRKEKRRKQTTTRRLLLLCPPFSLLFSNVTLPRKQPFAGTDSHHTATTRPSTQ